MTFSIIHATLGRATQALDIRKLWLSRADKPSQVEYLFGLHAFDAESITALSHHRHSLTELTGAGPNLQACAAISTGKVLVQAQDDIIPPIGWDTSLLAKLPDLDAEAFVCVSDGFRTDWIRVTSIMTRAYMERKARGDCDGCGFGHPGYFSMYWDTENSYRATRDGVCANGTDLVFYHDHPVFTDRPLDATYLLENEPIHYTEGKALFEKRNPNRLLSGTSQY